MKKNKIFISHSSADVEYVKAFVENILKLGLDINADRIFCTGIDGQGIKSGKYIPDSLREEILKSSLAILFISKNYKESEICLNELGAAWVTLPKKNVIPFLLPDVNFNDLGFLNIGRIGLKIYTHEGIIKFVQDCKNSLNNNLNFERVSVQVRAYLESINKISTSNIIEKSNDFAETDEWTQCYINNLYALDEIIRSVIPSHEDGIHQITDENKKFELLTSLSQANFLDSFWYKLAKGDFYVEKLTKLPSGNWIMSSLNWEINITDMWLSMNGMLQYEFILIKSEGLKPFDIQSDIGGTSYKVGILNDGTIISKNEKHNGYAVINGETIKLSNKNSKIRYRENKSNWIFLASDYHKVGYNCDEIFVFCEKLDSGEIEVNESNIMNFLRNLSNNPIVIKYM